MGTGNGNGNGSGSEVWTLVVMHELLALDSEEAQEKRINELAEERYWEVYKELLGKKLSKDLAREMAYESRSDRWQTLWANLLKATQLKQQMHKEAVPA
jgi:hypothetical protein